MKGLKMKKDRTIILACFMALFAIMIIPSMVSAATWYDVIVTCIGPSDDGNNYGYFEHDDPSPSWEGTQRFKFLPAMTNEMLATTMASMSMTGSTMKIRVMDDGFTIDRMYLFK